MPGGVRVCIFLMAIAALLQFGVAASTPAMRVPGVLFGLLNATVAVGLALRHSWARLLGVLAGVVGVGWFVVGLTLHTFDIGIVANLFLALYLPGRSAAAWFARPGQAAL